MLDILPLGKNNSFEKYPETRMRILSIPSPSKNINVARMSGQPDGQEMPMAQRYAGFQVMAPACGQLIFSSFLAVKGGRGSS